jgi:diacylglycerol kinase (ATP)
VRSLIVVNPVAGSGRAPRVWDTVRQAAVEGLADAECVATAAPGHARELARAAAQAGYERVVAIGGDGTANEVANGLVGFRTALGIIPAGTGDDCARNLGIPRQPVAAGRLALTGAARSIDLGEIRTALGSTYFVNVAGFGFDAEVAWRVSKLPRQLRRNGTLPYVLALLYELGALKTPRMRLALDGHRLDKNVFVVAVANGASYGGGMRVAPDASVDDGLFDVCVIGQLSRPEVLRLLPRMYSGGHRGHHAVQFFRCAEVQAESPGPIRCQADGELVGNLPATFKIHPARLRCVTLPR